jgi:hypothetical protein
MAEPRYILVCKCGNTIPSDTNMRWCLECGQQAFPRGNVTAPGDRPGSPLNPLRYPFRDPDRFDRGCPAGAGRGLAHRFIHCELKWGTPMVAGSGRLG